MLEGMLQALREGLHAVGLFSYELGAAMQGIALHTVATDAVVAHSDPLAQVLLFSRCEHLCAQDVAAWLAQQDHGEPAGVAGLGADIDEARFHAAIDRIHAWIESGDTYQVNFTYRLHIDAYGSALALYRRLRERQPVPYGALIAMPDGGAVLSFSPELFLRHQEGLLTAQPMKGTAVATGNAALDAQQAAALAADPKNRAENLMIVDLLRNDLGRVAKTGSVRVPQLFHVDAYRSVLQMTSTVQAGLRDDATLADIFAALYPCGSITGAPKRRTMQIIRELEPAPRGIYTGAIGWFDAPGAGRRVGDFCLSVPIRTLLLQPRRDAVLRGEMGVGAGIVHDSLAADELAECRLKTRFLAGLAAPFELFETMQVTRAGCAHLDRHLARLRMSASYFGFVWNGPAVQSLLAQTCAALPDEGVYRLRLVLQPDGNALAQTAKLSPLTLPARVLLAPEAMHADDLFLRHKTTVRARYDAAWRAAEAQGAFDMLFFNERGELTEGGRSNVFVKLDGQWLTPPLSCGLLPGVMRAVLLEDAAWNAAEHVITREDLLRADALMVCNALRGAMLAVLGCER